ncbi:MAG TPA: Holliday junction branch migration protein RuvA [Flexilinea sp.]|jgi:Holliday junction DNA helicase RuvA|nr:Holliday junction branch migration protein RuvA [Flexilinea sp.]OQA26482.1 MAG: Holliday junction ATP-dependent DNA helicase RuvA [Chloroflexi bacterium ADurb.Bin344]HNY93302.1 Holliday junction branch migration protein RuvA [Flexilinea sp.]HOG21137.1 Holliday junction branch migration protein RuvA [Flexilinea sp.]HOG59872.1 Holliday junction branch migration protein RuvA [Flexilinea sp.]
MISYLEGTVIEKESDSITVMVNGIGLKVYVPQSLLGIAEKGKEILLHTQLIVREDLLALYGFETKEEVEYFSLLMGVSGIGPRLALGILSTVGVDTVRRAVIQDQPDFLSRVPGVGKKTAQKVVLYLQGKISDSFENATLSNLHSADLEAIEALTALGYSLVQAQTAVQSVPKDTPDTVEDKIRAALQSLG